jgi:transcriptional regulator with XRE-family HTH domain
MRRSRLLHPLAVLRAVCGQDSNRPLGQKEMANLVGRAAITIQKIENKKLALSEELAQEIHDQTGVSPSWLLDGDPKVTPTTGSGEPYTRDHYLRVQADKKGSGYKPYDLDSSVSETAVDLYGQMRAILSEANRKSEFLIARYKFKKALDALAAEYGQNSKFYPLGRTDLERAMALMTADCSLIDMRADFYLLTDPKKGPKFLPPRFPPLFLAEWSRRQQNNKLRYKHRRKLTPNVPVTIPISKKVWKDWLVGKVPGYSYPIKSPLGGKQIHPSKRKI